MSDGRAVRIDEVLGGYLARAGLLGRLAQTSMLHQWPTIVGQRIAGVAQPESITKDGILFVRVTTAAWVQELQLMTPEILRRLSAAGGSVKKIVWRAG